MNWIKGEKYEIVHWDGLTELHGAVGTYLGKSAAEHYVMELDEAVKPYDRRPIKRIYISDYHLEELAIIQRHEPCFESIEKNYKI